MTIRTGRSLPALLAVSALILAACSDGTTEPAAEDIADGAVETEANARPGDGISVTMARANWASEYITAEMFRQIMTELGYTVSNPADIELGPGDAYVAMAEGDVDLWANTWFPGHLSWFETELDDGTVVGDHLVVIGEGVRNAGGQGFLVTKSWAEENNVISMDQISNDPALIAQLDAVDSNTGDGVVDVFGCEDTWTCDDIIDSMFAFYSWDNLSQTSKVEPAEGAEDMTDYDVMFAEFLELVNDDLPAITYTWFPSGYVNQAIPGENVLWITMHPARVLDGSNPLGIVGGEAWDQGTGFTAKGARYCTQPCQLGWEAADLKVAANEDFLGANPFLEELLPLVVPEAIDLQALTVAQANGDGSQAHLTEIVAAWRADNADLINQWIAEALAALS